MTDSDQMTKRVLSVWQFMILLVVAYILGLLIAHKTTVMEKVYWSGYELKSKSVEGDWVDSNRFLIGTQERVQEVRFDVAIDDSDKWQRPVGLMLGGPFSAEVFWDGEKIGEKGAVGESIDEERPGPIDSISFIPSRLLSPGTHQIMLRLSTQHLLASDKSVFHYIWLAPYRDSGKRDLRYYAAPLIILSGMILLSFQSFRIGRSAGNPMHTGLGLFGFSIIILLMSEISRAVINYPYHYHELRGIIGWIGNIAAGCSLMYTCYLITEGRLSKFILMATTIAILASHAIPMNSGDMRLALDFLLLTLGPAIVFLILSYKGNMSYLSTLPLFWLACVTSNSLSTGLFLDSFQFIGSMILIGGAWVWVYVDMRKPITLQPEQRESKYFLVKSANDETKIPVADCIALKGEGNYTTLLLADGKTLLHQDGIGAVMHTHPVGFVRVHKSYAVNTNAVENLKSAAGSKYWLEMTNSETIPVSRYRVAELRSILSNGM